MLRDWDIIEKAGREIGVSDEALRKWRVRGVPGRFHLQIVKIAQRDGLNLNDSAFDAPPGPRRQAAAEQAPKRAEEAA